MSHDKLLYTALILLQGCCAQPSTESFSSPTPSHAMLKRVWMMTEVPSISRERLIQSQARLDLTHLPHAIMYLDCEHFKLHVQMEHGYFRAQSVISNPFCQQHTVLAEQIHDLINQAKFYRVEGHFLTLTTNNGTNIRFVAQDWD